MRRSRPDTTILFLGIDRVARLDVGGAFVQRELPLGTDLDQAARLVLDNGPRLGRRTFILAEAFWTQTVELPHKLIVGLPENELRRAISYELETSSGIAADDAAVGFSRVESDRSDRARFWVTSARRADRDALAARVREHGSRPAGFAHPIGLASSSAGNRAAVEVWDQATGCFAVGGDMRVIGARYGQRSWTQGIEAWLALVNPENVAWSGRARRTALVLERDGIRDGGEIAIDAGLLGMCALAAEQLAAIVPLIPAPERPARIVPASLVCLVLTLCSLAYVAWNEHSDAVRAAELEDRSAQFQTVSAAYQESVKAKSAIDAKLRDLRADVQARASRVESLESELNAQGQRHAGLVHALGTSRPASTAILRVSASSSSQGGLAIDGAALDTAQIAAFATALEPKLAESMWSMRPATTVAKRAPNGANYFEFTIEVLPIGADGRTQETAAPKPKTLTSREREKRRQP